MAGRKPGGVWPKVADEKRYERELRRRWLDPMLARWSANLDRAESFIDAAHISATNLATIEAATNMGIPTGAIAENFEQVNAYHRRRFAETMRSTLGVDVRPLLATPEINAFLTEKTGENVALIKTIPKRCHQSLLTKMTREFAEAPFDQERLMGLVADTGHSAGYNLRRITRDQTSKAIGRLSEIRQGQLGVEEYDWATAADERVRETHSANSGLRFRWSDPPDTGHPGYEIQCRCVALPVINTTTRQRLGGGGEPAAARPAQAASKPPKKTPRPVTPPKAAKPPTGAYSGPGGKPVVDEAVAHLELDDAYTAARARLNKQVGHQVTDEELDALFADAFGTSDYRRLLADAFSPDNTAVYHALEEDTFALVLADRQLKNGLEAKTGWFLKHGEEQIGAARDTFGVKNSLDEFDAFPKYGYIAKRGDMDLDAIAKSSYGDMYLEFGPNMHAKATINVGDSGAIWSTKSYIAPAAKLGDPAEFDRLLLAMVDAHADTLKLRPEAKQAMARFAKSGDQKDLLKASGHFDYVEAQMYGKVTPDDMVAVHVTSLDKAARVQAMLDDAGVDLEIRMGGKPLKDADLKPKPKPKPKPEPTPAPAPAPAVADDVADVVPTATTTKADAYKLVDDAGLPEELADEINEVVAMLADGDVLYPTDLDLLQDAIAEAKTVAAAAGDETAAVSASDLNKLINDEMKKLQALGVADDVVDDIALPLLDALEELLDDAFNVTAAQAKNVQADLAEAVAKAKTTVTTTADDAGAAVTVDDAMSLLTKANIDSPSEFDKVYILIKDLADGDTISAANLTKIEAAIGKAGGTPTKLKPAAVSAADEVPVGDMKALIETADLYAHTKVNLEGYVDMMTTGGQFPAGLKPILQSKIDDALKAKATKTATPYKTHDEVLAMLDEYKTVLDLDDATHADLVTKAGNMAGTSGELADTYVLALEEAIADAAKAAKAGQNPLTDDAFALIEAADLPDTNKTTLKGKVAQVVDETGEAPNLKIIEEVIEDEKLYVADDAKTAAQKAAQLAEYRAAQLARKTEAEKGAAPQVPTVKTSTADDKDWQRLTDWAEDQGAIRSTDFDEVWVRNYDTDPEIYRMSRQAAQAAYDGTTPAWNAKQVAVIEAADDAATRVKINGEQPLWRGMKIANDTDGAGMDWFRATTPTEVGAEFSYQSPQAFSFNIDKASSFAEGGFTSAAKVLGKTADTIPADSALVTIEVRGGTGRVGFPINGFEREAVLPVGQRLRLLERWEYVDDAVEHGSGTYFANRIHLVAELVDDIAEPPAAVRFAGSEGVTREAFVDRVERVTGRTAEVEQAGVRRMELRPKITRPRLPALRDEPRVRLLVGTPRRR